MPLLDLKSLRIPYRTELDRLYDCSIKSKHPFEQFKIWFEEALAYPNLYEPNAMVLSTVSKCGRPSSRYVLLKGLDHRGFHFYTNSASKKGQDISHNPFVSLLFYWEPLKRQVRIDGKADLLPDAESVDYFNSRPKSSQVAAYVSDQSMPIKSDKQLLSDFENAQRKFQNDDTVPKPQSWVGYTVMPDRMEFWQGQTNRLHDRLLFFRLDQNEEVPEFAKAGEEGWYYERLAP
uniref:pyridoxal 5'-phosphate synthase n=1 Tax=Mesocestoides corti TaxID=53468 RepID=A0A5K3FTW8_MESCO